MSNESTPKKTYRLYAMQTSQESIAAAISEKYSRATATPAPGYVLIYTDKSAPESAKEITNDNLRLLTDADMQWLDECNAMILAEEMAKEQPKMMDMLSERVAALEAELERQKQEIETKED